MNSTAPPPAFTLADFRSTRETLGDRLVETPLLYSDSLSERTGGQVYLKAECFQRTHSFKIRGAYGALLPRLEEARRRGAVTGSSGNFAQGLAYACRALEVPLKVVMLERSAPNKVEAARRLGAEVVFCPNDFGVRTATVEQIARDENRLLVHSFDDEGTIRGNGSLALEVLDRLAEVDVVLVPASGGGILSATAAVVRQTRPEAVVYGVQPEGNPSMKVSLEQGSPTAVDSVPTLADGLIANKPGKLTFALSRQYVEDVLLVSDREIGEAVICLLEGDKLVIEPSGAVGVAALLRYLSGRVRGKKVVVVLTGGNVAAEKLVQILEKARAGQGAASR